MAQSRYQINAQVRRVFARHWIDLDRVHYGVHRGSVRVSGELHDMRETAADHGLSLVEALQQELLRIKDVQRVYFDLKNWQRDAQGHWKRAQKVPGGKASKGAANKDSTEDEATAPSDGSADPSAPITTPIPGKAP